MEQFCRRLGDAHLLAAERNNAMDGKEESNRLIKHFKLCNNLEGIYRDCHWRAIKAMII